VILRADLTRFHHSPTRRSQIKNLENKIFVANALGFALQAQVTVVRGQAGQGVDFHHAWVAILVETDVCAGDIQRVQKKVSA
jgi:hypothetical protein